MNMFDNTLTVLACFKNNSLDKTRPCLGESSNFRNLNQAERENLYTQVSGLSLDGYELRQISTSQYSELVNTPTAAEALLAAKQLKATAIENQYTVAQQVTFIGENFQFVMPIKSQDSNLKLTDFYLFQIQLAIAKEYGSALVTFLNLLTGQIVQSSLPYLLWKTINEKINIIVDVNDTSRGFSQRNNIIKRQLEKALSLATTVSEVNQINVNILAQPSPINLDVMSGALLDDKGTSQDVKTWLNSRKSPIIKDGVDTGKNKYDLFR